MLLDEGNRGGCSATGTGKATNLAKQRRQPVGAVCLGAGERTAAMFTR